MSKSAPFCASPRVVGTLRPDYYNLETMLRFPAFAGKKGEDMAVAIHDHMTNRTDGTYHFWDVFEGKGLPQRRRRVIDALKILNVYGWAICGQQASLIYSLYRTAGMETRQFGAPGHSLCEVFYEGRWHVLDSDMWAWFRHPDGHIASAYELAKNPKALITDNPNRSNPCQMPDRTVEGYAGMYEKCVTEDDHVRDICPPWLDQAHAMDFHLRPGETLVRSQTQQGCYYLPDAWKKLTSEHAKEWHGYPRERFPAHRTFGNGRWIYAPDLTDASDDFRFACWGESALQSGHHGLTGPGDAVIRIQSPYVFCGRPEFQGDRVLTRDGVWLEFSGEGPMKVEFDTPERTWTALADGVGTHAARLDITPLMDARYEACIRITLGRGATLRRLRFEGAIMTAPISLPRLQAGVNPMTLLCGDKFGGCTTPSLDVVDFRASANLASRWSEAVNARIAPFVPGWSQVEPAKTGPVQLTWRFDAPAGRVFAWAYALASVREGPKDAPKRSAVLEWSADGKTWKSLEKAGISSTHLQWDQSLTGEIHDKKNTSSVWVRITSETPVTGVEFRGHVAVEAATAVALRVSHTWREGAELRRFDVPANAAKYDLVCGADPQDHTIAMSVPSRWRACRK